MAAARARRAKVLSEKGQPANSPQPIKTGSSGPMGSILKALEKAPEKTTPEVTEPATNAPMNVIMPVTPAPVEAPEVAAPLTVDTPPTESAFLSPEPVEIPELAPPADTPVSRKPRWLSRLIEALTLSLIVLVTLAGIQLIPPAPAANAPFALQLSGSLRDPAFGPPFLVAIPGSVETYAKRSRADRLQRVNGNKFAIAAAPFYMREIAGLQRPADIPPLVFAAPGSIAPLPSRSDQPILGQPVRDPRPTTQQPPTGLLRTAQPFYPEQLAPVPAGDVQLVIRPAPRTNPTN